eukprot:scaffold1827_cov117-Isochrysis_galbana.AAC.1
MAPPSPTRPHRDGRRTPVDRSHRPVAEAVSLRLSCGPYGPSRRTPPVGGRSSEGLEHKAQTRVAPPTVAAAGWRAGCHIHARGAWAGGIGRVGGG